MIVVIGALGVSWLPVSPADAAPNIVLVLTDDLDKATLDVRPAIMPNLLSLIGQQGATFSNAFYNVPLCGPARATFLTGRYAQNTGVYNHVGPNGGFPAFRAFGNEQHTIATWLQSAGYRTGLFGKYLNKYPEGVPARYVPPGWSTWEALPYINGFGYVTDYLANKSIAFIDEANAAKRPFFVYFSTLSPHSGTKPAARHASLFPNATAPRTASFNEADISDKPPFLQVPLMTAAQIASIDQDYRNRLRTLQSIDEAILAIYRKIESIGQLDNTYFVFTSDNGYHMGQHRLPGGKETTYDEDLRMPLLISGPGIPAGQTIGQLASNADLAATFAAWAGTTPTRQLDGRSLVPLLEARPPAAWRKSLGIAHWNNGGNSPGRLLQEYLGVRTLRHSYARYPNNPGVLSAYNIVTDPAQLRNRPPTITPSVLSKLDALTTILATCAGLTCVAFENAVAP
jgi:arylsulfatase A-like enzyme